MFSPPHIFAGPEQLQSAAYVRMSQGLSDARSAKVLYSLFCLIGKDISFQLQGSQICTEAMCR